MAKRHLSFTNEKRIQINELMMQKEFTRKKGKKALQLKKLYYDKNSQDVKLLAGTPIISRVNKKRNGPLQ
jgi:hypothetical protein